VNTGMSATAATPPRAAAGPLAAKWVAFGYAGLVAATLGHFLLGLPIQVSDSFGEIVRLSASWTDLLAAEFTQHAYLRPFMSAEMKLVYDLSSGNYFVWFRGTHAAQAALLVFMYVGIVRPRTWRDAALLPLGLAVLTGLHTFAGTVRESFPINTYLTLLLCCLAAAWMALGTYRWWNDVVISALFIVAALTVESGLLVWVIAVGASLVGATGVSRRGITALVLLLGGYFYLRFVVLAVGAPDLLERSSGFGFSILEPRQLAERFGANPLGFYAYNIAASVLSVLLSEPGGGVFSATRAMLAGSMQPIMVINLLSSAAVCVLLGLYAWTRRGAWRRRDFHRDDRLVLLFGMVLLANAIISYPYTKDVIMSPAGVFLSLAVFAAGRQLLEHLPAATTAGSTAAAALIVATVGTAWAVRVEGLYAVLREGAVVERLSWAYVDSDIARGEVQAGDAHSRSMLQLLRHDALVVHPAPPALELPLAQILASDD
jgi:hypothetical protein